ncbi:TWiK family of potassium channels protein 18-like isoform X1 [Rhopalosiphum padi]|uniref:TWiK family of potassium channels protein 18-like isoform X1 n=1 Tax=Rhopalosiphum padi TaxID=40932 RepID=UPI00298E3DA6|nr:TWiK family of potassium channels protein 18-like isoform X1 [Rhopalosiphum padi]
MDGPGGEGNGPPGHHHQQEQQEQDNEHRPAADAQQLDVPKPPARRLSRSTMSLKIAPDIPAKPPKFQFFPSSPTAMCMNMPMTPTADPTIPNGFSPQLYQAYTSNKATDFFFKQLEGVKDIVSTAKSSLSFGERAVFWMYDKIREWSRMWLTHFFLLFIAAGYCAAGALIFQAVEGSKDQNIVLRGREQLVINVANLMEKIVKKNDSIFIETVNLIRDYESFFVQNNKPEWNYLNAVFYCGTVFTTIGYGHISPSTNTGRLITIVYAIFGIPIFLILLADFGKMFTRGIKFLWAFVRRLYYTGSCRKVRRTAPVQEVMKGVQMMYDITKFRRPSNMFGGVPDGQSGFPPTSPSTPALSVYTIDDEFNLPVSVAFIMLVVYIVIGAIMFCFEEGWGFFESFYFVFISMSTIGFGDFVPKNQLVMIVSIVYLVFGLALTSMCINVVQEKLQNSFRQATTKISATIGLGLPRTDNNEPAPIVVNDMTTIDADDMMTTIDADAVTDNDDD